MGNFQNDSVASDEQQYYATGKNPNDSDDDDFEALEKEDAQDEEDDVDFDFEDNGDEKLEEEKDGDKGWMAVKPFLGALVAPSDAPKNDGKMPAENLEVDWVYGYRGHDSRDNLVFDSAGRLVYPIAGFLIAFDAKEHTQQTWREHNDDIVCLAQSPANRDVIATGQVQTVSLSGRSKKPYICVTNVKDGSVTKLPARHKRAVRCVAFSKDGKYLASVGADGNNTVMIWDWASKQVLATSKGDTNKIHCIEWSNQDNNTLVTTGVKHLFFWEWDGFSTLKKRRGVTKGVGIQSYFCQKFAKDGSVLCGSKKGEICCFNTSNRTCSKQIGLHKGALFALCVLPDGSVATGGKDGFLRVLGANLKEKWSLKLRAKIRSINFDEDAKNLVVGCSNSDIYTVPVSGSSSAPNPVVEGHFEGEVWSLFADGGNDSFLTAGEDNRVFRWNTKSHKADGNGKVSQKKPPKTRRKYGVSTTSRLHPSQCARAIAQSPDGSHVAIGRNDGRLIVLDAKKLETVTVVNLNNHSKRKVKKQKGNWIEAMSYSPDGKYLAVGTHGIAICICDVSNGYKVATALKKHNSVITHLDWSKDGQHIRSTDKGYELLFYDIDTKAPEKSKQNPSAKSLKDLEWNTSSCVLTWGTQCVWDTDMDGSDVNAIDVYRKNGKNLVATGDDHGNVNLFRYPVLDVSNSQRRIHGHSAHVTNVRFTPDGKYLLTTGGGDKSVVQWKVTG